MNGGVLQLLNAQKVVMDEREMSADVIQKFVWPGSARAMLPVVVIEVTPQAAFNFRQLSTNPPTFVSSPHPAYAFDRTSKQFINLGLLNFSPGITGMSLISAFSFTGSRGNWERIIDFGNGPQAINFNIARQGTTNNLVFQNLVLPDIIQQNKIFVSVITYDLQKN
jgi:hypothetical protein